MYCIYRITNCVNGKSYIGQHKYKDTPYDEYMGSGTMLRRAYKKYGKENFVKGIIIDGIEEKDIVDQLERDYIAFEREHNANGCYNIADGGDGGNLGEEVNRRISEARINMTDEQKAEYRRKLSEAHKGKPSWNKGKHYKLSEEARKHMSEGKKGNQNAKGHPAWNKGLKGVQRHSEEAKQKMREAHKGKPGYWKDKPSPNKGKHWKLVDGKRVYIKEKE